MAHRARDGRRVLRALPDPPDRDRLLQDGGPRVAGGLSQQQRHDRDRHFVHLLAHRARRLLPDRETAARVPAAAFGGTAAARCRWGCAGRGTRDACPAVAATRSMIPALLKRVVRRGWTGLVGGFDHRAAQTYEMLSARGRMRR